LTSKRSEGDPDRAATPGRADLEHPIRAVLFDVDGTLLTTGGAGALAWSRACERLHGKAVDIERITESGMTDTAVARSALADALGRDAIPIEIDALTQAYLEFLPEAVEESENYRLSPGIVPLLERLSGDGIMLGLTTGNIEPAARVKLQRGDLNRFFSFGGFGSDSNLRPELTRRGLERGIEASGGRLSRDDFITVGDTPLDILAAHGIGVRIVGVATGLYEVGDLAEAEWALCSVEQNFPV
jgi:phosphoglycolate phosphatase-like HAD superfamily hydrolase